MTRAADRLGGGSSFGSVRPRSERGRAKAVAEGSIPDYELQRLPLSKVRPSLVNPRRHFGTDEEQEALGHSLARKQTTACVAVTRDAYLALWPEHKTDIGTAEWIILNGERRYRSANRVALEHLDFVVRDDLAATQADFIDYLMLENDERQDFNIIERARGLKDLLHACGGNAAEVARRRGKDRSWVGNQIALLTLPADIQDMLIAGTMAERYARRLARALKDDPTLDTAALLALAEDIKADERNRRQEDRNLLETAKAGVLSADNTPADPAGPAERQPADQPTEPTRNHSNIEPATPASKQPPAEAKPGMLSADNIPEQRIINRTASAAEPDERQASANPVLSADNTGTVQETPSTGRTVMSATDLVLALGSTPEEQAATLRAVLDDESYTALLEALYAQV
ncbi:ParB/RepB/Spo0J family partition protein [Kitasatospora griseola]|uniref:ParB/RepB/Spo0J family partition protein n=1 Tax=Kitasatospora griseola TaxID=2064 RepID=UPI0016708F10|nr:ParB/RepB/Spo0J family partition protein [Kitasatospora griseola]GGR06834.1 chromosome partitioning protein ParB [Kitasatospora griseola]